MKQPKIVTVESIPGRLALRIGWADGTESVVDVSTPVNDLGALESIRSPEAFAEASVGEWGWSVEWPGDVEMAAHNLYRMAKEQQGEAFPVEEFEGWLSRNGLSLTQAAQALGLSRRTIAYYKGGHQPIPKIVGLACKGWDVERRGAS